MADKDDDLVVNRVLALHPGLKDVRIYGADGKIGVELCTHPNAGMTPTACAAVAADAVKILGGAEAVAWLKWSF